MNSPETSPPKEMPAEIQKWNWGAFFLTWIWGAGNQVWISFLWFAPFGNLVMPFVLGALGNKLAWEKGTWASVEEFRKTQRLWGFVGLGVFVVSILGFFLIFGTMFYAFGNLSVFDDGLKKIQQDKVCMEYFGGTTVEKGFGMGGNIEISGPSGHADVSFKVKGDNNQATAYMRAKKDMGTWKINNLQVLDPKTKKPICRPLKPKKP